MSRILAQGGHTYIAAFATDPVTAYNHARLYVDGEATQLSGRFSEAYAVAVSGNAFMWQVVNARTKSMICLKIGPYCGITEFPLIWPIMVMPMIWSLRERISMLQDSLRMTGIMTPLSGKR